MSSVPNQAANMRNDPFLTHQRPVQRSAVVDDRLDLKNDPFITHSAAVQQAPVNEMVDMRKDPFYTGNVYEKDDRERLDVDPFLTHDPDQPARVADRHFDVMEHLGKEDGTRTKQMLRNLVVLPWLVFIWVLLLWLLMRHYSFVMTAAMTWIIVLGSLGCIGAWLRGRSNRSVPLGALGFMCLLAVGNGVVFGQIGWRDLWRQYWWTQTGFRYPGNTADTPAGARGDAAVLDFWDNDGGGTLSGTRVDDTRSAGYKNGHTYCVAPVLSPPSVANGGLARVNYWAIGVDCCQPLGSFTCDDSRSSTAASGVVMLSGGYPCPDCNTEEFGKAIKKAEAAHGLVSASGALTVRWVSNADTVEYSLAWRAILYILLCVVVAYPVSFGIAWILWFKGIGKGNINRQWSYAGDASGDAFIQASSLQKRMFHEAL